MANVWVLFDLNTYIYILIVSPVRKIANLGNIFSKIQGSNKIVIVRGMKNEKMKK